MCGGGEERDSPILSNSGNTSRIIIPSGKLAALRNRCKPHFLLNNPDLFSLHLMYCPHNVFPCRTMS